jgi:fructosamine-3-kinase
MNDPAAERLAAALGGGWRLQPLAASGFCATWCAQRGAERRFVKSLPAAQFDRLEAEADGLAALAATATIRVPALHACGADGTVAWLALEWLDFARADAGFGARFGHALGALHRAGADDPARRFGWQCSNRLGATEQRNGWSTTAGVAGWCEFHARERLAALRAQLVAAGRLSAALDAAIDAATEAMPRLFDDGHLPRPSLVHGDLWSGNWAMLADGSPVVFDPAVSYSDAEAELAMMELFGAPPAEFWSAYREVAGLHPGYPRRRPLYQLHHLLNHVLLFGGGYERPALAAVRALVGR